MRMKPTTATILSIAAVAGSATLAFAANTSLLGNTGTSVASTEAASAVGADPIAANQVNNLNPDQARSSSGQGGPQTITPEAVETSTGTGEASVKVFQLGRLGSVEVAEHLGVLSVETIDSAWAVETSTSGGTLTVMFTSGGERFRFDIVKTADGPVGALSNLSAPPPAAGSGGSSSGTTVGGGTRGSIEDDDERSDEYEEGTHEDDSYEDDSYEDEVEWEDD